MENEHIQLESWAIWIDIFFWIPNKSILNQMSLNLFQKKKNRKSVVIKGMEWNVLIEKKI